MNTYYSTRLEAEAAADAESVRMDKGGSWWISLATTVMTIVIVMVGMVVLDVVVVATGECVGLSTRLV